MLRLRKQRQPSDIYGTPLALCSADGVPLRSFSPEVVNVFRHMMTGLWCNGTFPSRISVVSALQGEGVTHTTLALATVLASDTGKRVCAVELNWWSPGMFNRLDPQGDGTRKGRKGKSNSAERASSTPATPHRLGLSDVLSQTITLDNALIQTDLPNLCLLPAGEQPVAQRPITARSAALKSCIEELGERFDHLVLDIPAILATSDAIALASLGSGCCLVIRQGVTSASQVRTALDDVKHLPMLGVVLNQVEIRTPSFIRNLLPQDGLQP